MDEHEQRQEAERQRLMALGRAAAQRSAIRTTRLADTLSPAVSAAARFVVDGAHAIHWLRRRDGVFAGWDYCARIDLPGVLPVFEWRGGLGVDDVGALPRQRFRHEQLDARLRAYTRAPAVLQPFANDAIASGLPSTSIRVAVVVQSPTLSVLEFDADVGAGTDCEWANDKAAQIGRVALALVGAGARFTEQAEDTRLPAEQLEALLNTLAVSTSWLSGPTARVGDGVEARLELDELEDKPCAVRVDVHGVQPQATIFLQAPLLAPLTKTTTLSPESTFFDRVRGVFDGKVGDSVFDAAWIIDGDIEGAKLLRRCALELEQLRRANAAIEVGPPGLTIRATFAFEGFAVVDAIDAGLRLWRALVRHQHGLND